MTSLIVLVEFQSRFRIKAIEVREQVGRVRCLLRLLLGATDQIVDDDLGMDFFLDVEWRRLDYEVRPVLGVFAAPDKLRIADFDLPFLLQRADLFFRSAGCARLSR